MTANELADKFNTYDEPHDWGVQAQAMLRQHELSDATIRELSVTFMLVLRRTSEDELFESVYEYSKLLLKKARGE